MTRHEIITGHVMSFTEDPFSIAPTASVTWHEALLIRDGTIIATGDLDTLRQQAPSATLTRHDGCLICPGFIDAHVHYPQTAIIASWGARLIDWLERYTFPEEMRFADPAHAAAAADRYLDLTLAHGTTTVSSFCTSHAASVDAFFTAAQARGLRAAAGKTCMDRNAPPALCDTAQSAYDDSAALIARWHGVDRLCYVITPRFAPTSSADQLAALGALWANHPDCLMQTHLSEQIEEIAWVAELFPKARDYLDVYETFGLLGDRALFGHAIHLTAREASRLSQSGAALIHCPTSNSFIGSGLFDIGRRLAEGQRIGLATDTGGGSSFSMLRTMAAAYEIGQLTGTVLHPAQLLWLATAGSARALHMGDRIGTIAPGMEADLVVLDLASTPAIATRHARADDIWDAIFPTIMMGDDRAIRDLRIMGQPLRAG
ncbi:guanine deaminase [Roseobacter sp. AzwK-3b]|uniref:guanine deaminase n=1 Tax=Roseobacter sp. AzwK-3b TaxID=351016 RepID=UPI0001569998|nr:guanine deaminase [Roseobacter sp. AzwK-3b]EDM71760.1 guanine deaminase [Roseobacter sp. AzwK-3b]